MAQNEQINIDLIINASQSAKTLKDQKQSLKDIREALDNVKQGSGAFELLTDEANRLTASMDTLTLSFEDVYGDGVKPLTNQLGELEDRMYALAIAGQKDSEEFRTLQAEAIKMRKTIIDVDDTVDAFAQKGAKLRGFIQVAEGITAGFAVAQGALALFGNENEEVEKAILKVQGAMALLQGVQALSTALTEKNALFTIFNTSSKVANTTATVANTTAIVAETEATAGATIATRIWNTVLKANPLFLLTGIITAVVGAIYLFTKATGGATRATEALNKALQFQLSVLQFQKDAALQAAQSRIALAEASGKSEKEITKLKLNELNLREAADKKELANITKQLATQKKLRSNYIFDGEDEKVKETQTTIDELNKQKDALEINLRNQEGLGNSYQIQRKVLNLNTNKEIAKDNVKSLTENNKTEKEKQKELRDIQIKSLIEQYNINKEAAEKLFKLKTEENNDLKEKQLELLDAEYASEYNKLIEQTNQKSVDDLNKSLESKLITLEQYTTKREEIEKNGFNNLTDIEKVYLNEFKNNTDKKKEIIIKSFNDEAQITKDETALINSQLILSEIEHNKEIELINAESLGNDIKINKAKTDILQKYLAIQIKAIQANSDNELKVLENNYNKDISNVSLTSEEKLQLEAKYNSDKFNIIKNTENKITEETKKSDDAQKQNIRELISNISDFAQALVSEISSLFNTISQGFVDANISQIESQKEQALKAYDEQTAAYSEMNSNMSNADRLKADKDKAILVERDKLEAEYDEKRKQAEYEGALISWRMSLIQAIVDGASFILKAGAQTGFFGVPAASILTGLQIGTILANPPQKFATGGYVSGEGGATDDKIPAMLSNGEYVINAASTSKNLPLLNMINAGATPMTPSLPTFATGGYVNVNNNNIVDNSEIIRIFEQYMSQPIKAYVVGNDVTQQQNKDNRLKSRTSF
jgi:hypothetical protein